MRRVTTEYTGSGDPRRSIELLWGVQDGPRRGPKPKLSLGEIVDAAIEVADAEGLGALSMRRVADHLGIATMSLYTYVPGKAELIDLMLDRVSGEPAEPGRVDEGWRARLELVARENWALYRRHPWLLDVSTNRPPLGPNVTAKYDRELRAVEGIGLTDIEMDSVLTLVLGHVHGAARGVVDARQIEQRTGMTDAQWWEAAGPVLDTVFEGGRYPTAARVGAAAGEAHQAASAPEHAFEFGLRRILDGVETFVRSRRGGPSQP